MQSLRNIQTTPKSKRLSNGRLVSRLLALLVASNLVLSGTASFAQTAAAPKQDRIVRQTHKRATPNPKASLKPIRRDLKFSLKPTTNELSRSGVLPEPLIPTSREPNENEDRDLAKALLQFRAQKQHEDISVFQNFLDAYPTSRWRAGLEFNLGMLRLTQGYLSETLRFLEDSWQHSKDATGMAPTSLANRAIGELMGLEARLGETQKLQNHVAETANRKFEGTAELRVQDAMRALSSLKHHPGESFKCGPLAVNSLLNSVKKQKALHHEIQKYSSGKNGTNLAELQDLAKKVGLNYQMAKRSPKAPFLLPSIIHLKLSHFAMLTNDENGRYKIQDPTFGQLGHLKVSEAALEAETDGYFLVAEGPLPQGWRPVSAEEAKTVWGKGRPPECSQEKDPCENGKQGGNGGSSGCGCPPGMPVATAFSLNATLNIRDNPIGYDPPIGPSMQVVLNYSHLEEAQPSGDLPFSNLGQNWSFNWFAYVDDSHIGDTPPAGQPFANDFIVHLRQGGIEYHDPGSMTTPNVMSQATLAELPGGGYQRLLRDGSVENYTLEGSAGWYLTSVEDPQGNPALIAYEDDRVDTVTDASGNVMSFAYLSDDPEDAELDFFKLASVSDAFGRTATFTWSGTSPKFASVTDAAGNTSSFTYNAIATSFIEAMTTPYGTTEFEKYTPTGGDFTPTALRVTYPDGTQSVIENWPGEYRNTYFWDRHAMSLYPDDPANHVYNHCTVTHWLPRQQPHEEMPIASWIQHPLETRTTYTYPDQPHEYEIGSVNTPATITRVLSGNPIQRVAIFGDVPVPYEALDLSITFSDPGIPTGSTTITVTPTAGQTTTQIANDFVDAINAEAEPGGDLNSIGVKAHYLVSEGFDGYFDIYSGSSNTTLYNWHYDVNDPSKGNWIAFVSSLNIPEKVTIGGTPTTGDTLELNLDDGTFRSVEYEVEAGDDLEDIATGLKDALNNDASMQEIGVVATSSGMEIIISPMSANKVSYTYGIDIGETETITHGPNAAIWTYDYTGNSLGYATTVTDPVGREFSYLYAENEIDLLEIRKTVAVGDPPLISKFEFESMSPHRPSQIIDGSGQATELTYNEFGQLETITDPNLNVTTFDYDAAGYLTEIDGPLSGTSDKTVFSYFGFGKLETVENSQGYIITNEYDGLNRLVAIMFPDGTTSKTIYDKLNAVLRKDRLDRWSQSSYNAMNELSFRIDALGRKSQFEWCNCGSLSRYIDAAGHVTCLNHDLQGRTIKETLPDGTFTSFNYEPAMGRLKSKTDALGQTKELSYTPDGDIQRIHYEDTINPTSDVEFTYDTNFHRLATASNGWGKYTYSYKDLITDPEDPPITGGGLLESIFNDQIANSFINFEYDPLGRLAERGIHGGTNYKFFTYDAISRLIEEENALGVFAYNYLDDAAGFSKGDTRLASIDYPNEQSSQFTWFGDFGDERLQQIRNVDPEDQLFSQFNYAYDAFGQIRQWQQQQNEINSHYSFDYDNANQLITAQVDSGSVFTAYISGEPEDGNIITVTAFDATLTGTTPVGQESATYTVGTGDTLSEIATEVASAINTAMSNLDVTAAATGSKVTINTTADHATTFFAQVSGTTPTTTIALSKGTSKVPFTKQQYWNIDCLGNQTTAQGDSTGSFPTGLTTTASRSTFNCVNELTDTTAGGAVRFQGSTTNPIKTVAMNVVGTVDIGSLEVDDTFTISFHNQDLPQAESVSHVVLVGEDANDIATALAAAINANTVLASFDITATSSGATVTILSESKKPTNYTVHASSGSTISLSKRLSVQGTQTSSQSFVGSPQLDAGTNEVKVTATSGGGTTTTESFPITVNGPSSQSFSYDDNGNMTSDGVNTYLWDAENRLIKIIYDDPNDSTEFSYDAFGRRVKIVETEDSSVEETKQFVWDGSEICEERDESDVLTKQFFDQGQLNIALSSSQNLYYSFDHLGSIREVTDDNGDIISQYNYDPYGKVTKIQGVSPPVESDFKYAGYYEHSRSGLDLTLFRAYQPSLHRWISRDPVASSNAYSYVSNDPINLKDPLGLANGLITMGVSPPPRTPPPPPPPKTSPKTKSDDDGCDGGGGELIPSAWYEPTGGFVIIQWRYKGKLDYFEAPPPVDIPKQPKQPIVPIVEYQPDEIPIPPEVEDPRSEMIPIPPQIRIYILPPPPEDLPPEPFPGYDKWFNNLEPTIKPNYYDPNQV